MNGNVDYIHYLKRLLKFDRQDCAGQCSVEKFIGMESHQTSRVPTICAIFFHS